MFICAFICLFLFLFFSLLNYDEIAVHYDAVVHYILFLFCVACLLVMDPHHLYMFLDNRFRFMPSDCSV